MRAKQPAFRRWAAAGLGIFFFIGLYGCMHPFSKDVMAIVERDRPFSEVIENPEDYIGSVVLWGGIIEEALFQKGETMLRVMQNPLNAKGIPQTDTSEGEFSAFTPQALDPQIFRKGTLVTIAGEIDRVEEKEQGPMRYPCPVLRVIEIHPWGHWIWGILPLTKGWQVKQEGGLRAPFGEQPDRPAGP